MAYTMYLAGIAVPVMPEKIQIKISGQNKTMNLIDGSEINLLNAPGLSKISFDLLLPGVPWALAPSGEKPEVYLALLERLQTGGKPFQWIVNRSRPDGQKLFSTNLTVSLEEYQIVEDANQGFDITVKVNLKQYRQYGTRKLTLQPDAQGGMVAVSSPPPRLQQSAPQTATYTVVKGDSLWNIAKKQLGDGARYIEIFNLNRDKVSNPNLIYPGQVLALPS